MSCYHPLPAIKKRYSDQYTVGRRGDIFHPYTDWQTGEYIEPISIPCGKCVGCRLDYSRGWADRCVLESLDKDPESCWFLTLTYDDNHIETEKRSLLTDKGTLTLYPKDVQDFMKRLRIEWFRRYNAENIRFYLAGEYGSTTARPHYHMLVYNLPIPDLTFYKSNIHGDQLFNSDEIEDLWGHGFVVIGKLEWKTAAYTARYVLKKFKGKSKEETDEHYKLVGLLPEFTRSSRRPGIAREYYENHSAEIYKNDEIILPNGKITKPPKYFDKLMKDEDADLMAFVKTARKHVAELKKAEIFSATTLDEDEYFKLQERKKENQTQLLTRLL